MINSLNEMGRGVVNHTVQKVVTPKSNLIRLRTMENEKKKIASITSGSRLTTNPSDIRSINDTITTGITGSGSGGGGV